MTTEKDNLILLIDWLNFTLKTQPYVDDEGRTSRRDITLDAMYEVLGIPESEWKDMPTGLHGYRDRKCCGSIWLLYNGAGNMGMHVQMSGQGCREYEEYWSAGHDWDVLFSKLEPYEPNYSRLDLACDDIRYNGDKPYFKVPDLIRRVRRGLCRSKWRDLENKEKLKIMDGTSQGTTGYFGSAKSMIRWRPYEKDKERLGEGFELEEGITSWVRGELQLRDDRAQSAIDWVLKGMSAGELYFGILSQYINFVDKTEDSHKERWPVSPFWEAYLQDALKLRLTPKAPDKTIPRKKAWLESQVEATLAEVWFATGGPGHESFVAMLERGLDKMTEAHWMRAETFRAQLEREHIKDEEKRAERIQRQEEAWEVETAHRIAATAEDYRAQQKEDAGTSPNQDPHM
ncbi:hypothetical protein GC101_21985 [Paenibacillus sp. LMG 31459]|uniref:Rolling Circle replication initiation protein N-terminal domain-containing protein n=1 Tax=Paenibacillus phytohabitans TaxID=2654978 RepID=A0ABX1YL07_9BACL|nr:replication initiation factor domain-containing protein [Paenibacillus phytohabitans]NOU81536.1 hypothetical protein [Paenibacillus phytohabitans]